MLPGSSEIIVNEYKNAYSIDMKLIRYIFALLLCCDLSLAADLPPRCQRIFSIELSNEFNFYDLRNQTLDLLGVREEFSEANQPSKFLSSDQFDLFHEQYSLIETKNLKELNNLIQSHYFDLIENKYLNIEIKNMKRVFDFLITEQMSAYSYFAEQLKFKTHPLEIYRSFLKETRLKTGLANQYDAEMVFQFFKWVQLELKKEAEYDFDAINWQIVFYGSFINGRALLPQSDIDSIVENKAADRFIVRLNDKFYFKSHFNVDHISSNSRASFSIINAAELSPVLFIVSAEYIEFRVYESIPHFELKNKNYKPKYHSFYL